MTVKQPTLSDQGPGQHRPSNPRLDRFSIWMMRSGSAIATVILVGFATTAALFVSLTVCFLIAPLFHIPPSQMPAAFVIEVTAITSGLVTTPISVYSFSLLARLRRTKRKLRAALADAIAASNSKSDFVAHICHEIRTQLNGILGMARKLENTFLPDKERDMAATIADSGNTMLTILNDILDLSKIEAGKLEVTPVEADLVHEVMQVKQLFASSAEEKGLDLQFHAAPDIPKIMRFDPIRVRQCVANLVSNAIKFTERGRVDVSLDARPVGEVSHLVTIRVKDTGIGIASEVQPTLFEDYAQADLSTSGRYGGTGLGLAITRKLALRMKGDITLESEPGKGSTFSLTLLAQAAKPQAAAVQAVSASSARSAGRSDALKGTRVLLTDDILVNRKVAKLFLEPLQVEIVEAENGVQALELLDRQPFDLVLLDVHMPVMDGWETLRRIRGSDQDWSGLPVIALTADNVSGREPEFRNVGFCGVVAKPIDERLLKRELQNALDGTGWSYAGAVA